MPNARAIERSPYAIVILADQDARKGGTTRDAPVVLHRRFAAKRADTQQGEPLAPSHRGR
jgi:hypothetical protein